MTIKVHISKEDRGKLDEIKLALRNTKYPKELLPKIPSLFFKLEESIGKNEIPLTPESFVEVIKSAGGSHDWVLWCSIQLW